jgi:putative Holliday junction resolvase
MAIHTPQKLKSRLVPGQRLLGLDIGEKTIGVAISDPDLTVASPIDTIRRSKFTDDIRELARLIAGREVGGIVIGLPINMDGTQGPRCQSVRHFGENLIKQSDILGSEPRIAFWDERLSTAVVQRLMIDEADLQRGKRAKAVDKMAAAYILQGALDALAPRPIVDS